MAVAIGAADGKTTRLGLLILRCALGAKNQVAYGAASCVPGNDKLSRSRPYRQRAEPVLSLADSPKREKRRRDEKLITTTPRRTGSG